MFKFIDNANKRLSKTQMTCTDQKNRICLTNVWINSRIKNKPKASEVLTSYLKQTCEPPWTSYFVRHKDVVNDQYGMSKFNWQVGESNYLVLRVGCFPYIKYHCTKAPVTDLEMEDKFFRVIKILNLGIPCLLYGMAALFLITHKELVHIKNKNNVFIYFLMKENTGSRY